MRRRIKRLAHKLGMFIVNWIVLLVGFNELVSQGVKNGMLKKVAKQVSRELAEIAALFVSHIIWWFVGWQAGKASMVMYTCIFSIHIIEGNNKNKQ